jgi:hypothetical protein
MSWAGSGKLGRLLVAAVLALPCASNADILYAASVRSGAAGNESAISGSLYTVNLGSGAATFVAPLRIDGASPIGITGLSAHPQTGVLYGITSQLSPTHPQSLVMVDPATGNATLVGELRFPGSDIAFNRAGILFTWLPATSQLAIVNLANGSVTPIGTPGAGGTIAGLAIDQQGTAYITPSAASTRWTSRAARCTRGRRSRGRRSRAPSTR